MCLNCGHYNGRQVMDLEAMKQKRDARMKAKQERIKNELGAPADTGLAQAEEASEPQEETTPEVKDDKKPKEEVAEKKVEKPAESK